MATLDRIDPAYVPWTPSHGGMAAEDELYNGRHRRVDVPRGFSLRRLLHVARHRAR